LNFLVRLIQLNSEIGNTHEASKLFDENLEKIKKDSKFYFFFGIKQLHYGNFDIGWKYYEYRGSKTTDYFKNTPEWNGQNIREKNIVVYSEQGFGDSIQFSKYLLPLGKISKNVSFIVDEKIIKLFNNEIKNLFIETKNSISRKSFDYKISLGSLLKYFYKEKLDSDESLIKVNNEQVQYWKTKIDKSKLNVGLAWSGSLFGPGEPYRSIPLKSLNNLLKLNANFYCLQNFIWERDKEFFNSSHIVDFGKYDLDEIASIIKNLDVVISVDTSILHLSASLNQETWGIFHLNHEWRWGKFFKFNPYKSLKFFNQKKFNNWDAVEAEIFDNLEKRIEAKIKEN